MSAYKIPAVNQGLEVLFKIFRVSFYFGIMSAIIGLLPYFGIDTENLGVFSFVFLGIGIYILVDTYRGFKLLQEAELDVDFTTHIFNTKNYLSYAIIAMITGGTLFVITYSMNAESVLFVILSGSIIFAGYILFVVHLIKSIDIVSQLGTIFNKPVLNEQAKKVKNLYFINIVIVAIIVLIEIAVEFQTISPLGRDSNLVLEFVSSSYSIYFSFKYYQLYQLSIASLEEVYSENEIIGNTGPDNLS